LNSLASSLTRYSVSFENEGQQLFGFCHVPVGEPPFPAVLFCHGFAGNKVGFQRQHVRVAEQLAEEGIAVLRFDYRGCGDSEGDLQEMMFSSNINDALVAFEYLKGQSFVDSERMGILGRSLGGAIAIHIALTCRNVKSLALWAPASNTGEWSRSWEAFRRMGEEEDIFLLDGVYYKREFLEGYFSEYFSSKSTELLTKLPHLPLLHLHGEKDLTVSLDHTLNYEEARRQATAESKFLRLSEGDHRFTHPDAQEIAIAETCHWFQKTLQD